MTPMQRRISIVGLMICAAILIIACRLLDASPAAPASTPVLEGALPAAHTPVPSTVAIPDAAAPTEAPSASNTAKPPADTLYQDIPFGSPARIHLEELVADIGSRPAGTNREVRAGDYIQHQFESWGFKVERQTFTFYSEEYGTIHSANLVAVKAGISAREIVVGAHYDSGEEGAGADDNASGVGVLLETAQRVSEMETPYTIRFIAFGAEENGLIGSRHFIDSLDRKTLDQIVYMVNLDSLIAGEIAYVYGDADFPGNLRDAVLGEARRMSFEMEGKTAEDLDPPDNPCECSDYFPFKAAGIPYIYFEATNWNLGEMDGWTQVDDDLGDNGMIWHTHYDRIDYIEVIAPGRIDERLETFTVLLVEALTKYEVKD